MTPEDRDIIGGIIVVARLAAYLAAA